MQKGSTQKAATSEMLRRIVLAWDPDYTKLTPAESKELEKAMSGEYYDADDIDWEHLERYTD